MRRDLQKGERVEFAARGGSLDGRLRVVGGGVCLRLSRFIGRLQEFGDSRMEAIGRLRIRTEHNSVGRDIVQVGDLLLFGFNVYMGLKATTSVADVFGIYRLVETGDGYDVAPVDIAATFASRLGVLSRSRQSAAKSPKFMTGV